MSNLYQLAAVRNNEDWVKILVPTNAISFNVTGYTLVLDNNYIDITGAKPGDIWDIVIDNVNIGKLRFTDKYFLWKGKKFSDAILMTTLRKAA